jgi:hypothetical protein
LADCTVVIGRLGWMALFEYFVRTGIADAEPYGQCSAEMAVRMHMLMQYFAGKMAQHLIANHNCIYVVSDKLLFLQDKNP